MFSKFFRTAACSSILVLLFAVSSFSQVSGIDPNYNAVPSIALSALGSSVQQEEAITADGKVLIWGGSLATNGLAKGKLARLNADGSVDTSFTYCHCGIDLFVNAAPLPDGKVLVAGRTGNQAKVVRLNIDGSLDPTFTFALGTSPPPPNMGEWAAIVAIRDDGKIYITKRWSQMGHSGIDLYRVDPGGSVDTTFTPVFIGSGSPNYSNLSAIELLPGGGFFIAITTNAFSNTYADVKKYTAAGTIDSSWTPPAFPSGFPLQYSVSDLSASADGSLLVAGWFTAINGTPIKNLVRLMPAGNVDLTFTPPDTFQGAQVQNISGGKILYSASSVLGGGNRLMRLNSNGSLDPTYTMDPSVSEFKNRWAIDASERTIFVSDDSFVRLLSNGTHDTSFNSNVGAFGTVSAVARQSDGKVLLAGTFTKFNGAASANLVRTEQDGTLDSSFNPGTGFSSPPSDLFVQPDGKIIAIGTFLQYNGAAVGTIIRILPNGALDTSFNVTLDAGRYPFALELLSDGRIYIGGNFSTVNGTLRPGVARLNSDGSLDTNFNALIGGIPTISAVRVQPDGKVLIGGNFSGIGGFNRSGFARVDSTGALDQAFDPSDTSVGGIYVGSDGKIYTTPVLSASTGKILRRMPDGNVDPTYADTLFTSDSGDASLKSILVRSDGTVIVGGKFDKVAGQPGRNLIRLTPTGTLDAGFMPKGADLPVARLLESGADKAYVVGNFALIDSVPRAGNARFSIEPYRRVTPFDFDGDGKADFSVFRPSSNTWYQLFSSGIPFEAAAFGSAGDQPVPADFDGDGKTDLAIFRPSSGQWWYRSSITGTQIAFQIGAAGDRLVPSDFDADGKADYVVYRPSTSQWFRFGSTAGSMATVQFGIAGDIPVVGDFDGDGKGDLAIFRASTGDWWYAASGSGNAQRATHFGANGDIPAPADFDGDGKTDMAIFRPSTGVWYVLKSSDYSALIVPFGLGTDKVVPADYDGDGKADIAVFRPSTGIWYVLRPTEGFLGLQWGNSTDIPAANSYITQGTTLRTSSATTTPTREKQTFQRQQK